MSDGDKVAAAILAVEATKQALTLNPQMIEAPRFSVAANLVATYRGILRDLRQPQS